MRLEGIARATPPDPRRDRRRTPSSRVRGRAGPGVDARRTDVRRSRCRNALGMLAWDARISTRTRSATTKRRSSWSRDDQRSGAGRAHPQQPRRDADEAAPAGGGTHRARRERRAQSSDRAAAARGARARRPRTGVASARSTRSAPRILRAVARAPPRARRSHRRRLDAVRRLAETRCRPRGRCRARRMRPRRPHASRRDTATLSRWPPARRATDDSIS